MRFALLVPALALCAGAAGATTYTFTIDVPLAQSGRVAIDPFTIVPGDDVDLTFNFDTPFVATDFALIGLGFEDSAHPPYTATSDYVIDAAGVSHPGIGLVGLQASFTKTDYKTLAFSVLHYHAHINTLIGNPRFDLATFYLGATVPEPATWAMLIVGFFVAGGLIRKRRDSAAFPRRLA